MKRYKPVYRSCDQYGEIRVSVAEMEEDQYGEWVKYEDVKDAVDQGSHGFYNNWVEDGTMEYLMPECSCGDHVINLSQYWVCPAHGYKKR